MLKQRKAGIEQALAELEYERLQAETGLHFEHNPQPMWILEEKTLNFVAVNQAAIRCYGYSRSEFLQMSAADLDSKRARSSKSLVRGSAQRLRQIRACRTKDGMNVQVDLSLYPTTFRGTNAILVLASQRRAAGVEVKLRQSEELFSKALQCSPMSITISTMADGRYLKVNDSFLRLLGLPRSKVVGHTAFELHVWESRDHRARVMTELDRVGRIGSLETTINSAALGSRNVQISAERINLDGISCVLGMTQDITEKKALEQRFRQAYKTEAFGSLAGGIAHDFNNILGVIMGYCDLAASRPSRQAMELDIARIRATVQRAARLTDQLLNFNRPQMLTPTPLNLNRAVRNWLQMLDQIVPANVALRFIPSSGLGKVRADLGQVEQILLNLVINARDAMPHGGRIIIETANLDLDHNAAKRHPEVRLGRYVVLSVSDTGCGMSAETLSKIFQPFFTTKQDGHGTGLGLSIVHEAMKRAGGHISVRSEEGAGTNFQLYFPRVEEHCGLYLPLDGRAAV